MSKKAAALITIIAVIITNAFTLVLSGPAMKVLDKAISGIIIDTHGVSFENVYKYNKVKELLKTVYIGETDDNELMEGSIMGLAAAVNDPYTEYLTKEDFESLQISTKANYAGIGVVLGVDPKDNLIMVSEVFENSPGEKSGIRAGDKIIKVNDTEVDGDIFEKAVSVIRGEIGTSVKLSILRKDENKLFDISVTRDEIEIQTVKYKMINDEIGYIRIIQFAEKTADEFEYALKQLSHQGMTKLIIDERDNPGGLLTSVVDICSMILPKGVITYTVDKRGIKEEYYSKGESINIPYAVLINERSASASEILAGAVKDYKRGTLVGMKTYGKGVVQSVLDFNDGSGIKITTSQYYTPKGIYINKIGVKPDIEVELGEEAQYSTVGELTEQNDLQLKKAVEFLSE